jgi:1,2-dihydroxy-3-keto-5-methylthiopentene dioxygenase
MTILQVMADGDAAEVRLRTADPGVIGVELARRGIVFDRWPTMPGLGAATPTAEILADYSGRVTELNSDGRYKYIDLARLQPDDGDPRWPDTAKAAREKFLSEHRHAEDEVRLFVAGRGCFYLHLEPEVGQWCARAVTSCRCRRAPGIGLTWVSAPILWRSGSSRSRTAGSATSPTTR